MDLHIFDCSNYIYAGSFFKRGKGHTVQRGIRETDGMYEANSAPIGGVSFLIRELMRYKNPNNILMPVFDRPAIKKRQMYLDLTGDAYGYKGNRKPAENSIVYQKEYAETILRRCGFPVQSAEEYEADDVIYTLVQMYKDDFEKIYIHTKDSDLHFLVSEKVEIAKVGTNGKSVDLSNYYENAYSGQGIWYNSVLIHKLIKGDVADNIPGIGEYWRDIFEEELKEYMYPLLGDLDYVRKFLRELSTKYHNVLNAPTLTSYFNLLVPLVVPYDLIDNSDYDVDWDMFRYYVDGHDSSIDRWDCEELLLRYIDRYYE